MKEKVKTKFQESKIYKAFRRVASLGLAGTLAIVFPNEIIAWLSAGAGILYGKGLISFALMSSIVTFLGSAAGILVQKIVLCGLTYLFSNIILKQGKRLFSFISRKMKAKFSRKKSNSNIQTIAQTKSRQKEKTIAPAKTEAKEIKVEPVTMQPIEEKAKVKTLGVHPSMR